MLTAGRFRGADGQGALRSLFIVWHRRAVSLILEDDEQMLHRDQPKAIHEVVVVPMRGSN